MNNFSRHVQKFARAVFPDLDEKKLPPNIDLLLNNNKNLYNKFANHFNANSSANYLSRGIVRKAINAQNIGPMTNFPYYAAILAESPNAFNKLRHICSIVNNNTEKGLKLIRIFSYIFAFTK